ncbi:Gamma interferon inducible lysosomal thiol reductase GILT [Sesbania bispinosa]|nr:Gamma interferon inducible lysosomal thiol reductase GILT [Sesbania bispinosa]
MRVRREMVADEIGVRIGGCDRCRSASLKGDGGRRGWGAHRWLRTCRRCSSASSKGDGGSNFIVNHLVRLFQTGLISIVNLRMVPWGNAWIAPDATVICQHGDDECLLNTIEACAITIYPDVVLHFRLVRCLERLTLERRHSEWVNCFQMTGLGTLPIDCYTSGNGKAIEQKYAKETAQLNPPHRFVPWVVVNNQALQEDYQNFVTYICRAYKGKLKPDACRSLSTTTSDSNEKINSFQPVCYVDEARNLTLPLGTSQQIKE